MDHTELVKEQINKKHKESKGSCGTYIPDMASKTNLSYPVLFAVLKQLYEEKFFIIRQGINGKMIFKV